MGSVVDGEGQLVRNDAEGAAVERARALRAEGKSLQKIAAALDAEGHRPRGPKWHVQTLSRMVRA